MTDATPASPSAHPSTGRETSAVVHPAADWPAHTVETRAWQQRFRGGTREDRMLTEIDTVLPPRIVDLDYELDSGLGGEIGRASYEIAYTEGTAGRHLAALGRFLVQTESVSSSKIEQVEASTDDFARALAGSKANSSATSMVAATAALTAMVNAAGSGRIDREAVLSAHEVLMREDPTDGPYAGRLRSMQNWTGGSNHSPRGALHIPPPPEYVDDYIDDLVAYANRDDVPALVQAAVVHAQFESIHPFTDGNGRIGRALINAVFRRRRLTRATVVPVATAMVADRQGYFDLVNGYRAGRLGPFVRSLATSAIVAAEEARQSAERFSASRAESAERARPRAGSAASLLDHLLEMPVLTIDDAIGITGGSASSAYAALDKLVDDGIVHEVTGRVRDRVWAVDNVMAELDDLSRRIAVRVTTGSASAQALM